MRYTKAPYDDAWAIARLREVWEWAVAQKRPLVAYLAGMAILAFEVDDGSIKIDTTKEKKGVKPDTSAKDE